MKHSESKTQIACVKWFRLQYPKLPLFSIPNGGRRGKIEAAIMKAEGTMAGAADLMLAVPKKEELYQGFCTNPVLISTTYIHGLFIELKSEKGKQTDTQKEFQKNVESQGYQYSICKSFDEFQKTIQEYIGQ